MLDILKSEYRLGSIWSVRIARRRRRINGILKWCSEDLRGAAMLTEDGIQWRPFMARRVLRSKLTTETIEIASLLTVDGRNR